MVRSAGRETYTVFHKQPFFRVAIGSNNQAKAQNFHEVLNNPVILGSNARKAMKIEEHYIIDFQFEA